MQPLAPWRSSLAQSLHLNRAKPHSRYFQLATVAPEGEPRNRTVVFRGFRENTNQIKVVTDRQSEKIEQIQYRPRGEICWYFTQTREQFRFFGQLMLVGDRSCEPSLHKERQQTWQGLSDAAKLQFVGSDRAIATPPTNFCLLLLDPERAYHLQLRSSPHSRQLYQRDEQQRWTVREA
ncbi:MAG: pyridoxamine 5'-phosphate oxidase family protein [Cyanobacteriota bacterium]|nr:pyridoxamine 5'-phosphate oxidase family protein [Cyanobacteriota bacterium]